MFLHTLTFCSVFLYVRTQCIYTSGRWEWSVLNDFHMSVQQEILARHFAYFGLVSKELLAAVVSQYWRDTLIRASAVAEEVIRERPFNKFDQWG